MAGTNHRTYFCPVCMISVAHGEQQKLIVYRDGRGKLQQTRGASCAPGFTSVAVAGRDVADQVEQVCHAACAGKFSMRSQPRVMAGAV